MKLLKKAGGLVLGAVGAVVGFIAGGPVGAAIGFSIGMGIGSAAQLQAMKTKVPDISSATNQRLNVSIDPDAYRKIAFGETALGTDQVYWESWGPENSYLDQVIAAAGHEIESFGALYFEDEEVAFSGNAATGEYAGVLTKQDRTVGVTGSAVAAGAGGLWTQAASLTGVAHYALRIQWSQEKFPRGVPNRITRVGRGAKVYDPRRDSTVPGGMGSHRADDQSTWEYAPLDSNDQPIGRNPALQILWYEIGWRVLNPDTGEWVLTCGRGRPVDDIDFASFVTAANDCEDNHYYSDVLLSTGDAHATNIAVLEAACAGKLMDPGGRISLRIRTDTTGNIVQAFTDADIVDSDAAVWRPSLPGSQRWNQGRGAFVDPRALYRLTPLPAPVRFAGYEAEDGWKRPGPEFRYDAVQDPEQVQKLIWLELNISRYMGVFTAPFNWRAKKVRIWDIVTLTSPSDGFEEKIFRVLDKKTDPMGAIWLLLREDDPSIYTPGPVMPVPPPSPTAGYDAKRVSRPDAGDWDITPVYRDGGGARIPILAVVGDATAPNIVATHIWRRVYPAGEWIYVGRFAAGAPVSVDLTGLLPGQQYQLRMVYENAYGAKSPPTDMGPFEVGDQWVVPTAGAAQSVGGYTGQEIIDGIDSNSENIAREILLGGAWRASQEALMWIGGEAVGSVAVDARELNEDTALSLSLLGVRNGSDTAFVLHADTTIIPSSGAPGAPSAISLTTLRSQHDGNRADIVALFETVGGVATRLQFTSDVNGHINGMIIYNDGVPSSSGVYFLTSNFAVVDPGNGVTEPFYPFAVSDGVVYMDHVVVRRIRANSVEVQHLQDNSTAEILVADDPSTQALPSNATWLPVISAGYDSIRSMLRIDWEVLISRNGGNRCRVEVEIYRGPTRVYQYFDSSFFPNHNADPVTVSEKAVIRGIPPGVHYYTLQVRFFDANGGISGFSKTSAQLFFTELKQAS